jgi:hypothetical protein
VLISRFGESTEAIEARQRHNRQGGDGHGEEHRRQLPRVANESIEDGAERTRAEVNGEIQAVAARAFGGIEQVGNPVEQNG